MFCPECGNTDKPIIKGVCQSCFLKKFSILKIPKKIEVTICAHCNAKFEEGKWDESNISETEIIYRALENSIIVDPLIEEEEKKDLANLEVELEIVQMRGTIAECHVEAIANIFGETLKQTYESEVRLKKSVCPSCSKQQSGYYEAVIQLRADERELSTKEIEKVNEIVNTTLNNISKKDKLAYLVQTAKLKEGNDYYIGSYKSAKKIVEAIKEEFGGIIKESPRLISQDKSTGKGLYRIWISIRLPRFKKGDFIRYSDKDQKRFVELLAIDGKRISLGDLANGEKIAIPWKEYGSLEYLKNKEDIQTTTVISKSPTILQILDPDDYSSIDLNMIPSFRGINIGDEVKVIKIENNLYLLLEY